MVRIASLMPGATDILVRLGLSDRLVAVSHACALPAAGAALPGATRALAGGPPGLVADVLREVDPDLVLLDAAAAPPDPALPVPPGAAVLRLSAQCLDEAIGLVLPIARAAGVLDRGLALQAELRDRLRSIEAEFLRLPDRPRVLALDGVEPLRAAGGFLAEMVERAGGTSAAGEPSSLPRHLRPADLLRADPDILLLAPADADLDLAEAALRRLIADPAVAGLRCVRTRRIYALEGRNLTALAGPRLVDGVGVLARLFRGAPPSAPA